MKVIKTLLFVIIMFIFFTPSVLGVTNLITNGNLTDSSLWNFYSSGTGTFTIFNSSAKLTLGNSASNIQLYQYNIPILANTRYQLSFDAYSNSGHDITVRLIKHISPYNNYAPDFTVNLGTSWQTFSTEFTSSGSALNDGRLQFWLAPFATAGDIYYIDNVVLNEVSVTTTPTPTPTPSPTSTPTIDNIILPTPRENYTFNQTLNENFNGTELSAIWRTGYSDLQWCETCPPQLTGINVSNGTLNLQSIVTPDFQTGYNVRAMLHTGGQDENRSGFLLYKGGYVVIKAKLPYNHGGNGNGRWPGLWFLPVGKYDNSHLLGNGIQQEELDMMESVGGGKPVFSVHDYYMNEHQLTYPEGAVDTSQDHLYGFYWRDDGSKYGSVQVYFDNVAQGVPIVLDERSSWGRPLYLIIQDIPCPTWVTPNSGGNLCDSSTSLDGGNPFIIDFVYGYQEVHINDTNTTPIITEPITHIHNGEFVNKSFWNFYTSGTGIFTTNNETAKLSGLSGNNIQLFQTDVTIEPNASYRISFDAYSQNAGSLYLRLIKHISPYTNFGLNKRINLTTEPQRISINFTSTISMTSSIGRLMFDFSDIATPNDVYYIDNVTLERYG